MTYFVDPTIEERLPEIPTGQENCIPLAQQLIECLGAKGRKVRGVKLKGETIEVEIGTKLAQLPPMT